MKKKKHFILSEEEKKELDRRIENITNHPETLVTWEDVKEKMTDIKFAKDRLKLHKQNPLEGMTWKEVKKKIKKKNRSSN